MKKYITKDTILWGLFSLAVVVLVGETLLLFSGWQPHHLLVCLKFILPLLFLFLHIIWTLGWAKGLLFVFLSVMVGFIFEIVGVRHGTFFGGEYIYHASYFGPLLFNVPILVGLFRAIFLYTAYTLSTSFLTWMNVEKPNRKNKRWFVLCLLILLDALLVVGMDMLMDPILISDVYIQGGAWTWLDGGAYFGVPLGNFVGWFCISCIATGIFRTVEYFFPRKKNMLSRSSGIIPILGYGLVGVASVSVIWKTMPAVAMIGLALIMPVLLLNVILFVYGSE